CWCCDCYFKAIIMSSQSTLSTKRSQDIIKRSIQSEEWKRIVNSSLPSVLYTINPTKRRTVFVGIGSSYWAARFSELLWRETYHYRVMILLGQSIWILLLLYLLFFFIVERNHSVLNHWILQRNAEQQLFMLLPASMARAYVVVLIVTDGN
ncbi:MAG: hypothetical protein M3Y53_09010, partial [Thermoproteota archaeon]|nr:hypothetical protein [Thermoproteota archaeon]